MELPAASKQEKIKLGEINQYLTCYLCKGYLIDATTISECLHSFCRSCIIKFLQDNSYCPVCEVIINKAKPNLKLDKTLQDIVYKLVPELFLKEMLRRKTYYKDYPNIAARVSPEERGEDTERTIFNPHEMISLSLEYICDDSTPGAIRIPGITTDNKSQKDGDNTPDEAQMKRYLLCPGMCRIEVLKKFVRNKYNVDTNQFFIDILYKRVPLPDHYTLIDIGYIYSWQRNELMKFFFRIIDLNAAKRTESPVNTMPVVLTKRPRGSSVKSSKKREKISKRKSLGKLSCNSIKRNKSLPGREEAESNVNSTSVISSKNENGEVLNSDAEVTDELKDRLNASSITKNTIRIKNYDDLQDDSCKESTNGTICDIKSNNRDISSLVDNENNTENNVKKYFIENEEKYRSKGHENGDITSLPKNMVKDNQITQSNQVKIKTELNHGDFITDPPKINAVKLEPVSDVKVPTPEQFILKVSKDFVEEPATMQTKFSKPVTKSYTSITLNRSENVEIITKIEPVSKDGRAIGQIIKQTIKKGSRMKNNSPKKSTAKSSKLANSRIVISRKTPKKALLPKTPTKQEALPSTPEVTVPGSSQEKEDVEPKDEKSIFFESIALKAVSRTQPSPEKLPETTQGEPLQQETKRKHNSPSKSGKFPKTDVKKPVKIILQEKPSTLKIPVPITASQNTSLQSLIDSCKINIPSSLSITIKESSEDRIMPPVVPPVKNYIEILKLPDESLNSPENSSDKPSTVSNTLIGQLCDNDSEQKVDQDLSEIAKSLTEKIPLSTTISHIVGPKQQQFQIPIKTNQLQIQPAPVPELNKLLSGPLKDTFGKLTPRSPQTFQKIFEESLRKTPEGSSSKGTSDADTKKKERVAPSGKRNILDIASQLSKKTKLEEDKLKYEFKIDESPLPKIPIPRLPHPRNKKTLSQKKYELESFNKMVPQTVANLHSSSLGMNYSVSIGQKSPSANTKVNGIVSPVRAECPTLSCKSPVSPLNELKPIKAEFKVPSPSLGSPKLPEVSSASCSPRPLTPSSKCSPKSSPVIKHMYTPLIPHKPINRPTNKLSPSTSKLPNISPKPMMASSALKLLSPKPHPILSPKPSSSSSPTTPSTLNAAMSTNEIMEKFNIPNLSQLTATLNINPSNQISVFQQAMLRQYEFHNRQNWLNQGPLLQYLQSLNGSLNGS